MRTVVSISDVGIGAFDLKKAGKKMVTGAATSGAKEIGKQAEKEISKTAAGKLLGKEFDAAQKKAKKATSKAKKATSKPWVCKQNVLPASGNLPAGQTYCMSNQCKASVREGKLVGFNCASRAGAMPTGQEIQALLKAEKGISPEVTGGSLVEGDGEGAEGKGLPLWGWLLIGLGGVAAVGGAAWFVMKKKGGA